MCNKHLFSNVVTLVVAWLNFQTSDFGSDSGVFSVFSCFTWFFQADA